MRITIESTVSVEVGGTRCESHLVTEVERTEELTFPSIDFDQITVSHSNFHKEFTEPKQN